MPDAKVAVVQVACPLERGIGFRIGEQLGIETVLLVKVTVPVGWRPPGTPITRAVNVTDWVCTEGFRLLAIEVVGLALCTVCTSGAEGAAGPELGASGPK